MSMCAPKYYSDPEFKKWFDEEKNQLKDGAPQSLIDKVKREDEERDRVYEEALKKGICL